MGRVISTIFVLYLLTPAAAYGQTACLPYSDMVDALSGRYDERRVAGGLAPNGKVIEVFTSPEGETWTLVFTTPDGAACVMAAGVHWDMKPMGIPIHAAPSGWVYPSYCCGEEDCAPIEFADVEITGGAYRIKGMGITVLLNANIIKQSPDDHYHICIDQSTGQPRCFFVPTLG